MYAINPLDYDNVTAYIDAVVPDGALDSIDGVVDVSPRDREPYRRVALSRDLHVTSYPVRTKVSGSPHKHVHGESVGVFGPAEMGTFAEGLASRLGIPLWAVLNARVSRLDVSVNLHVDHDVAELLPLLSAPPQMEEVQFRTGTKVFKNGLREIMLYDKVQKLIDKKNTALVPRGWEPGRVLRVEVKFIRLGREFGRTVTVGDLCTRAFYKEASARWLRWVSAVGVREGVWTVPRGGRTVHELRDGYAEAGLDSMGGKLAALRRIDRDRKEGILTSSQASRQRRWVANVPFEIDNDAVVIGETIAGQFKEAIEAAAASQPPRS